MPTGGDRHARELIWGRTPDTLRALNRRRVLRAIMVAPATQVHLADFTRLSQATVSGIVQELQRDNVVAVDGTDNERGKKIGLTNVRGVAIGVEVSYDTVTVAARRVDGPRVEVDRSGRGAEHGSQAWMRECVQLIRDVVRRTGLDETDIVAIGLGIPAAVDPRTSTISQVAWALDWERGADPGARLQEHFPGVPVIMDNEANYAAYGEHLYGGGRGTETMLFVKSSTSVSAGLVIGGLIYRGRHGLASEIGHLVMDPNGVVCQCGNRGCLETAVGGARLVEQVRRAYVGYRVDLPTSLANIVERAKTGDLLCRRVLQDAGRGIGIALARTCNLLNPEKVFIGGELGRAADLVIEPAVQSMRLHSLGGMFNYVAPMTVETSELGLQAGALGALAYALTVDHVRQN
ncbi:ROK family transcriptional regulator [Lentzea albida]|uniref:Sugar kinase of the NBD/HSP70 family, may contain an N-terminal HTH domain n=1 Tax=Lentzea albida TaxID=65499 RepID=A0A1H9L8U5_9PSEU|nr:ROK family transcriptional regulator [Lentzea albida]SER07824.1 Sugar kinase of the NBD/HSP70 family, may contain an N-terminal HTH domain [Lentzea albida]